MLENIEKMLQLITALSNLLARCDRLRQELHHTATSTKDKDEAMKLMEVDKALGGVDEKIYAAITTIEQAYNIYTHSTKPLRKV